MTVTFCENSKQDHTPNQTLKAAREGRTTPFRLSPSWGLQALTSRDCGQVMPAHLPKPALADVGHTPV